MDRLVINVGEKVLYKNQEALIVKVIDLNKVSIKILKENIIYTVDISELKVFSEEVILKRDLGSDILSEKEWALANRRYKIIEPLINTKRTLKEVSRIAKQSSVHYTTIYRWLKLYDDSGLISSLARKRNLNGKFKGRLSKSLEDIINSKIESVYLTPSKRSIKRLMREIVKDCLKLKIEPPHENTVRNRIKNLSEEEKLRRRYGFSKARDKYHPIKGNFPGADFPLSVVQIDHTLLDIILVDEHLRNPFERPYITLAVDVFSRMILGFYLSFDPPGEIGTGLCISHAILPKDIWMEKTGVNEQWPCWGVMKTIHLDNAKEFRGKTLRRACQNYGISIEYRPPGTPNWGGHVERALKTISEEIHDLPGTTFSKVSDRENYDSKKKSSFTLNELEKWLTIYITKVYHKRLHSSINMSPLEKFKEGILGSSKSPGTGMPPRIFDERRVQLDFMPMIERTVQEYGVLIDHITYYDEVLRRYINAKSLTDPYVKKRKFIFKRDPRDISVIYFYDPELNDYFEIPYRDTSKPAISIWEYRSVIKKLKDNAVKIDEESIFNGYKEMEEIELNSIKSTKSLRKNTHRIIKKQLKSKIEPEIKKRVGKKGEKVEITKRIEPFEDIEDETFN
ncbi:Mu transposase C-terminal domain-containing protein [Tenacibaculum aestuarii]|uniref:Mu transposase C-terminal domain-containing protein n=1 Tax=Tenacibaculum aestuarii TaxID=362781 RepID=UPI003894058A